VQAEQDADKAHVRRHRIAAIISGLIWTISLFLSFVVATNSPYIWMPDFLLLVGFCPLLYIWRPVWPWFVFGLLNAFIGMVLETTKFLPDQIFPGEIVKLKHHLSEFHVGLVWILIGLGAIFYGALRLVRGLILKSKSR
jgi:hypothetical protein